MLLQKLLSGSEAMVVAHMKEIIAIMERKAVGAGMVAEVLQ